jgi:YidC/Oxa1 family membrane protein insertase
LFYLLSNPFTGFFQQLLLALNSLVEQYVPLPPAISSYAIAIVLVALLVKVITYPLTASQQRSMRSMQALQPKLAELQKRHKGDRDKMAQAQMELYREHGVNPFGGCMPLVVQMVVLLGLYRAVMSLSEQGKLSGEQFLWIPDLAKCEPSPFCGAENSLLIWAIPILVILMVVSQFFYQKFMTPPTTSSDPQQQVMNTAMKLMPLFFAYFFINLPAGLVLYYAVFNFISIVQQIWLNRRLTAVGAPAPVAAAVGNGQLAVPKEELTAQEELSTYESTQRRRRRRKKSN